MLKNIKTSHGQKSYDQTILYLINNNREEPPFLFWQSLNRIEKMVLKSINKGNLTNRKIRNDLLKEEINYSLRAIQMVTERLCELKLIEKIKEGKEYKFKIITEGKK